MVSLEKHNSAAYDPAVLYWDWEKTRIGNRPPGLGSPQPAKEGSQDFDLPGQPRAGLKRANAFFGDENSRCPLPFENRNRTDDKSGMMKDENSTPALKTKPTFPESLYSEAKRKTIEDMGNKFMRTIQSLDNGNSNKPVDFNPILEKHWAELAEFYSTQTSTIRMLERKLRAPPKSTTRDIRYDPQVQLPVHLVAQLKELKLRPFPFMEPERKSNLDPSLVLEEGKVAMGEVTTKPLGGTVVEALATRDESYEEKIVKTDEFTPNSCPSRDKVDRAVYQDPMKDNEMLQTRTEARKDFEIGYDTSQELLPMGACIKLVLQRPDEAAHNGKFFEDAVHTKPEILVADTSKFNTNDGAKLPRKEDNPDSDIEEAEDIDSWRIRNLIPVDLSNAYLVKDGNETPTEGLRLTVIERLNLCEANETETKTNPNALGAEIHILSIRTEGVDLECPIVATPQQPHNSTENQAGIYSSDPTLKNNKPLDQILDNEDPKIVGGSDIPKVGSLVITPCDNITCMPEEITLNGTEVTLLPQSQLIVPSRDQINKSSESEVDRFLDLATAEPLPQNSNDSFPVSDDSYLFSGSSSSELKMLQVEVTDHLEKAEEIRGSFIAKWVDEFGVRREGEVNVNEPPEKVAGTGINKDGDEEDSRIEEYETEYMDDGEDGEGGKYDERDESGEQVEEMMALIALQENREKGKYTHALNTDNDEGKEVIESDSVTTEETEDITDGDEYESMFKEQTVNVILQKVFEKELSVVDEEDEEDEEESEGVNEQDGKLDEANEEMENSSGYKDVAAGKFIKRDENHNEKTEVN